MTPVQKDPDADEANSSVLIMSTIHPVEYMGTPLSHNTPSSGRLKIQEVRTRRMDDEASGRQEIQDIPTRRMNVEASGQLEIQDIPTRRMDAQEVVKNQTGLEGGSSPAKGMDGDSQELLAPGMKGQQFTSTPNLTPVSSPTKQTALQYTAQAPPVSHFLPVHSAVPMCPDAADFLERAPLPAAAPTTDFTSSQRLILPPVDILLNTSAESEAEVSWLDSRQPWTAEENQAIGALLTGSPAGSTTTGPPTGALLTGSPAGSTTTGPPTAAEDISDSSASPLDSSLTQSNKHT